MLKLSYSFFGFGRRYVITLVSWDRIKISDRLWWLLIWLILENRNIAILHCYSQSRSNVAGGLTLDEVPGYSDLYFREKWGSLPPSGRPTLPFMRNEVLWNSVDDLLFFSGEVRFVATQWTTYSSFLEKWGSLSPSGRPTLPFGRSEVGCHPVDDRLFLSREVRFVASQWTTYTSFRKKWGSMSRSGHLLILSGVVRFIGTQWTTYSSFW